MLLDDKIILISGGTRGLGAGIARAAAAHGATGIMITGRDQATGEAVAAELAGNGTDIRFHAVDLADPLAAAGSVGATVASFGRLDCVVNSRSVLRFPAYCLLIGQFMLETFTGAWPSAFATPG